MKKTLCYLSFVLVLGAAVFTFSQCSEQQEDGVKTLSEQEAYEVLSRYVTVENLAYKLNITEDKALKLGVSPETFGKLSESLRSINEAVAQQLAEDPDAKISLSDPQKKSKELDMPLKSRMEITNYISAAIFLGDDGIFTWGDGNKKIAAYFSHATSVYEKAYKYAINVSYFSGGSTIFSETYHHYDIMSSTSGMTSMVIIPLPDLEEGEQRTAKINGRVWATSIWNQERELSSIEGIFSYSNYL